MKEEKLKQERSKSYSLVKRFREFTAKGRKYPNKPIA